MAPARICGSPALTVPRALPESDPRLNFYFCDFESLRWVADIYRSFRAFKTSEHRCPQSILRKKNVFFARCDVDITQPWRREGCGSSLTRNQIAPISVVVHVHRRSVGPICYGHQEHKYLRQSCQLGLFLLREGPIGTGHNRRARRARTPILTVLEARVE